MVSLGKTNTPEFGSPCYTEPDVAPPAVTPWDPTRMAGGSSGGAAAAVAAGLVPVAQGSDGGGSIRIPASCCGLVGLKPTRGRISGHPMYGDPVGPGHRRLARPHRPGRGRAARRARGRRPATRSGRRLRRSRSWPRATATPAGCGSPGSSSRSSPTPTSTPSASTAWESPSALLESLGHDVVDIPVPLPPEAVPSSRPAGPCSPPLGGAARARAPAAAADPLAVRARRACQGPEFGLAIGEMRRYAAGALTALAPYDAVLTPDPRRPAAAGRRAAQRRRPGRRLRGAEGVHALDVGLERHRHAGVSLPLHWTPDGLPVGVMLAARPAEEELLLALSAQVEAAAPWAPAGLPAGEVAGARPSGGGYVAERRRAERRDAPAGVGGPIGGTLTP